MAAERARLQREVAVADELFAGLRGLDAAAFAAEVRSVRAALQRARLRATPTRPDADPDFMRLAAVPPVPERARALALAAVAVQATLGLNPQPHQLLAALALTEGRITELAPGAGKTLALHLAAVLLAWTGLPVHVIAPSDALAARAAAEAAPLLAACDLRSGTPQAQTPIEAARAAWRCAVVFVSARQLITDFAREKLQGDGSNARQVERVRALRDARHTAAPEGRLVDPGRSAGLIDDVESVLIDDAVAPLVVNVPGDHHLLDEAVTAALPLVERFVAGRDYTVGPAPHCLVRLSPAGEALAVELAPQLPPFWRLPARCEELLVQALIARDVLVAGRHYAVDQGRITVLDEHLTSLLGGRSWPHGVLQAVEARNGLQPSLPPRTLARVAFQEFFPRYRHLGATATTLGARLGGLRGELRRTYGLRTLTIPSATTTAVRHTVRVYADRAAKLAGLVELVARLQAQHLPQLICTPRLRDAAAVVEALAARQIILQLVTGKDPEADAAALARAGQPHAVTLVIGAAGLGTEIVPDPAVPHGSAAAPGGLQVILFEANDQAHNDRLFFGRAGRRQTPGQGWLLVAADDEILLKLPRPVRALLGVTPWRVPLARALLAVQQWRLRRRAARHRQNLLLREEQLDQQLAFARDL